MKQISLLLILFFCLSETSFACELKSPLISLSASISSTLRKLALMSDSNLLGISEFHYAPEFKKERWRGGVYLAEKKLRTLNKTAIFFDQSQQLKKRLSNFKEIHLLEIATLNKSPYSVIEESLEKLKPFLKNCDEQFVLIKSKMKDHKIKNDLLLKEKKIVFLLGEIKKHHQPTTIMNHDGWTIVLKEQYGLEPLFQKMNYVKWSDNVKKTISDKATLVGLVQDKNVSKIKISSVTNKRFNIIGPEILAPGWGQLELLEFFLEKYRSGFFHSLTN